MKRVFSWLTYLSCLCFVGFALLLEEISEMIFSSEETYEIWLSDSGQGTLSYDEVGEIKFYSLTFMSRGLLWLGRLGIPLKNIKFKSITEDMRTAWKTIKLRMLFLPYFNIFSTLLRWKVIIDEIWGHYSPYLARDTVRKYQ